MNVLARLIDRPPTSSPLQQAPSTSVSFALNMKDVSSATTRAARSAAYPKKRPSPAKDGVSKRKSPTSNLGPPHVRRLSPAALTEARRRQLLAIQERLLLEEEYRADVRAYMHEMELLTMSSASSMDQQPEIRWEMRPCLVDFIVEIHLTFRLRPETLYLTLNIVDRYVSRRVVFIKHYQLVGCTALWIAAKFEDAKDRVPTVQELAHICRDTYDENAFTQMEGHVLATIQWMLGHPTAESWLRLACCGAGVEDTKTQHVARFLMEVTLFHREYVSYPPSAIACGALILGRFVVGKSRRPYDESELGLEIVDLLDKYLISHAHELSETLVKKYSYPFYSKASTIVLQFYLEGRRFSHQPLQSVPPISPMSTSSMSSPCTPMSSVSSRSFSSSASSEMDDMPATPTSPAFGPDPFVMPPSGISSVYYPHGKENVNPTGAVDVLMSKGHEEGSPNDLSGYGNHVSRMALLELNAPSPNVAR